MNLSEPKQPSADQPTLSSNYWADDPQAQTRGTSYNFCSIGVDNRVARTKIATIWAAAKAVRFDRKVAAAARGYFFVMWCAASSGFQKSAGRFSLYFIWVT